MSFKTLLIGKSKSLEDRNLFHKLWLTAVFAWVGLGADGLSSSCYGPEQSFHALAGHSHLGLFVALMTMITIAVICLSYSQIIALFPSGGGGYLVASKLLSPGAGVVSGSALLIDYVLTITLSVASGADAIFSLPWLQDYQSWKLAFELFGLAGLTLVNLRGVRESVMLWTPIFFLFIGSHAFGIVYATVTHASALPVLAQATGNDVHSVTSQVGVLGLLALLLKAYSMGAGTFTGIEAVSNGLPILKEPRVKTGRRTMLYMGVSLAVTVGGLMLVYLLCKLQPVEGKTLNAVFFENISAAWGGPGRVFLWLALTSEALLLLIAAQAGFLDGPRVLANMALDRWLPTQFANLSDRFVAQNGILLMGAAAAAMMWFTHGRVDALLVFYSINVFITFTLSQAGMVRHWWSKRGREPQWKRRLAVNFVGLSLTSFILVMLAWEKFFEGGWVTLAITAAVSVLAFLIHRHYANTRRRLARLDGIVSTCDDTRIGVEGDTPVEINVKARTAVVLVNGYNGLGLHTLLNVTRLFGDSFRNYVFIHVGAVDAGNFKGAEEIETLRAHSAAEAHRYVRYARAHGYGSEACTAITRDIAGEILVLARKVSEKYPHCIFFGGQLVFSHETFLQRLLHNHLVFLLQRRFFLQHMPFVIVPVRVSD